MKHGVEIKEPTLHVGKFKPLELCEFFYKYLPEKLDNFTGGLPPVTARFLMNNNQYVSFNFDDDKSGTKVSLAEYNTGRYTGMIQEFMAYLEQAKGNKKTADLEQKRQASEVVKRRQAGMEKAMAQRGAEKC